MNELERLLRHREWLRRLAARLVTDGAAADDLAQEVWLAVLEGPPDPRRPVRPWMLGVARRLASLRTRTNVRREIRERAVARKEAQRDASEALERIELEQRLARAVLALPEPARSAVVLRYFEERSVAEVARELDVPEATVRTRTKRGIELLRERLDREWGGRGAWCVGVGALARGGRPEAASIAAGATLLASWKVTTVAAVAVGLAAFFAVRAARFDPSREAARERTFVELEPRVRAKELASSPTAPVPGEREPDAPAASAGVPVEAHDACPLARFALAEPNGAPAAQRRVALVRAGGAVERGVSDAQGRVEFAADGSSGALAIERPEALPFVARVALFEGEERIDLPRGVELGGTLAQPDGSPAAGLALESDSDTPGRLRVAELLPERPFEVRAVNDLGAVCATAHVDGVAPGETLELVLELPPVSGTSGARCPRRSKWCGSYRLHAELGLLGVARVTRAGSSSSETRGWPAAGLASRTRQGALPRPVGFHHAAPGAAEPPLEWVRRGRSRRGEAGQHGILGKRPSRASR